VTAGEVMAVAALVVAVAARAGWSSPARGVADR
jgi:hypothetical protein